MMLEHGELVAQKRGAEGHAADCTYYDRAGLLLKAIGRTQAERLCELTPDLPDVEELSPEVPGHVQDALERQYGLERDGRGRRRLTFDGYRILVYLRAHLRGHGMYGKLHC